MRKVIDRMWLKLEEAEMWLNLKCGYRLHSADDLRNSSRMLPIIIF